MNIKAKLRYLHIAPRKVRLVADLIRGKSVDKAQGILNFTDKKASIPLLKLLKTAVANAKNNFQFNDINNFYISRLLVDEGPKYKRWRPRSRGMANEIQKKTSHISLVLTQIKNEKNIIKKFEIDKKDKQEKKISKIIKTKKYGKRQKFEIPTKKINSRMNKIFRRKAF